MKKIMILASIALFAICAQSAEYKWTIKNITQCDPTIAGYTTSTAITSGSNYQILLMYSAGGGAHIDLASGTIDYGTDQLIGSSAPLGSGGLGAMGTKFSSESYADGQYYYAVLFNSKGTTSTTAYDYYAIGAVLTGDPGAVSPVTPLSLQWTTANQGTPSWQAASTPEPTSGLLLLLGMAGLALKRKRA